MHTTNKFLPVPEAIEAVTGSRPHPATCWRWTTKGQGGHVLKSWMVGGRRKTTVEEVTAFIERRTEDTTPSSGVSKVRAQLNKELGLAQ